MTGAVPANKSNRAVEKTFARQAAICDRRWGKHNEARLGVTVEAQPPQATSPGAGSGLASAGTPPEAMN
jgi:hypothetical protein